MNGSNIVKFIISIAIPLAVGAIAGFATSSNISTWYALLNKPSFNPPNYLFGPVWTLLYVLMGISFYLIWKSPDGQEKNNSLLIFGIQLLLNFAWSFIFFYYHQIAFALIEIFILWICLFVMIMFFKRVNTKAAYLQIPYLLWVSFATSLNAAIYMLN